MEKEDGIESVATGLELPAETALSAGLQTTNTAEGDGSGQLLSSNAGPGMSEGSRTTLRKNEDELSAAGEVRRLQAEETGSVPPNKVTDEADEEGGVHTARLGARRMCCSMRKT